MIGDIISSSNTFCTQKQEQQNLYYMIPVAPAKYIYLYLFKVRWCSFYFFSF